MKLSHCLEVATEAARMAGDIIRYYADHPPVVEHKADTSPVTAADREAETAIRKHLNHAFPEHGFYGEEYGREAADAEYIWLIDPLDGTKSFVRGTPYVSTQIALWHKDRSIVAVSHAPFTGETASAIRDQGATLNGQPLQVSSINTLRQAHLSTGNLNTLARNHHGWQCFGDLVQRVDRLRGYGDFAHYHMLAGGKLDIVIESDVNILDIAALSLIVEEAGGKFTNLQGKAIDWNTTSAFASNTRLHSQVLDIFAA
ncbi:MAG TPA: inositol monophosphatase family protein [Gammaproteobacteria bacterium]|nr:inositol monophosphatase family protein [Gammaproteobacteria bacterium]